MGLLRNLDTKEQRAFWLFGHETALEVSTWPEWMRGERKPAYHPDCKPRQISVYGKIKIGTDCLVVYQKGNPKFFRLRFIRPSCKCPNCTSGQGTTVMENAQLKTVFKLIDSCLEKRPVT